MTELTLYDLFDKFTFLRRYILTLLFFFFWWTDFYLWVAHSVNFSHLFGFKLFSRVKDEIIYLERDHELKY